MLVAVQSPLMVLMLVAFAHRPDVAASLESCTFLLRCTLQLAGSLAVAPRDLACLLAPRLGSSSSERRRFTHSVQLGPRFLFAYLCLTVTGAR